MKLFNIKSAFGQILDLYGIEVGETAFENLALNAWELIGNKHTRLYRYIGKPENKQLILPCNAAIIESVHLPVVDAQLTGSDYSGDNIRNQATERYIDARKGYDDLYYQNGKYVKYEELDGILYFKENFPRVMVVYHGIAVDDEGLPLINDKEMRAIAAYVAYATLYREGLLKRDATLLQIANLLNGEWLKLCNSARIPTHLSQNDMDAILDAKVRWDRKIYGKSYKPIV